MKVPPVHTSLDLGARGPVTPPLVAQGVVQRGFDGTAIVGIGLSCDGVSSPPRALPAELVLRALLDLDVRDLDAVAGFMESHGLITLTTKGLPGPGGYLCATGPDRELGPKEILLGNSAMWLLTAQSLVRHWLIYEYDDGEVHDAWADWARYFPDERWTRDNPTAWAYFARCLNRGLETAAPRIEVDAYGHGQSVGVVPAGLYSGLCVQLYNLMVLGRAPRRCSNETCHRAFIHRDAGDSDSHRWSTGGVKFCSTKCAKLVATRAWRERERAKR